ncbi:N-6 DNA methylase [Paenibacillus sp. JCM 10914]|uniref:N-6 DNA methylase n=1 Tax=Paenibacillus sp. JCM 10914 TaxID=1236974 RepID=UPI0003CCA0D7|nr:N-6 DNA methylase [Paenibacillus sp. JCM 10914]GAE09795.1 hypothetical protein JCM10914_6182 [Paenibacillus sp. JCM 10914]
MKETETLIKRVIPYLNRRGYEIDNNMFFEESIKIGDSTLFQDIVIKKSKAARKPMFVIEVKKDTLKIEQKHINQALNYGSHADVPFVVVTNGVEFRLYNVHTKKRITFNEMIISKIPAYSDMDLVLKRFTSNPTLPDINLTSDKSLPFKPTVSASQLEDLLKRCHNIIRNVEKDETHIFGDLSKIIFLKLLEEKIDSGDLTDSIPNPLTLSFYELAERKDDSLTMQTIKNAITQIFTHPKFKDLAPIAYRGEASGHEEVSFRSLLYIKKASTFQKLVNELAKIHFMDAEVDVKGTVFEYFIRTTLQGRKGLGQYFTPRPIIHLMYDLINVKKLIVRKQMTGKTPKIVDPACGSGGFLVYGLGMFLKIAETEYKDILTLDQYTDLIKNIKEDMFYGQDANPSIVVAAKMNMIIAGDGASNIYQGNTLSQENIDKLKEADVIMANPPFGSSESDSLTEQDMENFDIKITTAQGLFIQQMIASTKKDGEIVTIIDESILNSAKWKQVREYIINNCFIEAIVSLPKSAFAPNKINVKTSILYLKKKNSDYPEDILQDYPVRMIQMTQVGYNKKGDIVSPKIEEISKVMKDRWNELSTANLTLEQTGGYFESYPLSISEVLSIKNLNIRIDYKYHDPLVLEAIQQLVDNGAQKFSVICNPTDLDEYENILRRDGNPVLLKRGKTPVKANYNAIGSNVRMIKAGNIGKTGPQEGAGIDYVTEELANNYKSYRTKLNDVLLASTGEGTLGKSLLVKKDLVGGLVDSHVTIIRLKEEVLRKQLLPDFVVWFLRSELGQLQIDRLYTGSTGQIEFTERDVEDIYIPFPPLTEQVKYVRRCRALVMKAKRLRIEAEKAMGEISTYNL